MRYTDNPQHLATHGVQLGTAGWSIRRDHSECFEPTGTHLQRYAGTFNAVEINSCFYRPHRLSTYERWAASVPESFRFAVKLPKAITHEARFVDSMELVDKFLGEVSGLGKKVGPVLVQLPPSFAFDGAVAIPFLTALRERFDGDIVLEPRHETWFTDVVDSQLTELRIARVAADPARVPIAAEPGGWRGLHYYRLHGSPRIYYSAYSPEYLEEMSRVIAGRVSSGARVWCIFDNTALGAAARDALAVQKQLAEALSIVA